jgi:hypothetical protein
MNGYMDGMDGEEYIGSKILGLLGFLGVYAMFIVVVELF